VRLVATGADADSPFLGWNRFDCEGTGPCTVTAEDSEDVVVARFRQQRLEILHEGAGTVTVSDGTSCPPSCIRLVDAGTELTLEATAPHAWGRGCDPRAATRRRAAAR
jgi:hypothetical protein